MVDDPKVVKFEAPLRYGDVDLSALAERVAQGEIPLEFAERVLAEAQRVIEHSAPFARSRDRPEEARGRAAKAAGA